MRALDATLLLPRFLHRPRKPAVGGAAHHVQQQRHGGGDHQRLRQHAAIGQQQEGIGAAPDQVPQPMPAAR
jgi:hypothetical protein